MDANEETADFHAFSHTFITWLILAGIPCREVMELARRSESRLTDKAYMDARQLPLPVSLLKLPVIKGLKNITHQNLTLTVKIRLKLSKLGTLKNLQKIL